MGLQSPKESQAILIVDNNVFARNFLTRELGEEGFFILAAANCEEAIRLSQSFEGEIQLLISNDDLQGRQGLADTIKQERPGIRFLLIQTATHKELIERGQQRARWLKDRSCMPEEVRKAIWRVLAGPASRDGPVEL